MDNAEEFGPKKARRAARTITLTPEHAELLVDIIDYWIGHQWGNGIPESYPSLKGAREMRKQL